MNILYLGYHTSYSPRYIPFWRPLPRIPSTKKWSQAGLVTYADGTQGILAVGGENERTSEFLEFGALTWKPKQSLPNDIYFGASVPFRNSLLMVGGESNDLGKVLDTIYFYDQNNEEWQLLDQRLSVKRRNLAAFMVPDSFANCF